MFGKRYRDWIEKERDSERAGVINFPYGILITNAVFVTATASATIIRPHIICVWLIPPPLSPCKLLTVFVMCFLISYVYTNYYNTIALSTIPILMFTKHFIRRISVLFYILVIIDNTSMTVYFEKFAAICLPA